jgi:hypothetical protein
MSEDMNHVFADALAVADGNQQAEFFNRFVQTLDCVSRNGNGGGIGQQEYYIAERISVETARFFERVADTHKYHREEFQKETFRRDELRRELWDLERKRDEMHKAMGIEKPAQAEGLAF